MDWGSNPLKGMVWGHFDLPMPPNFDLYYSLIKKKLRNFAEMKEWRKMEEVGLIVSQICKKKL